MFDNAIAIVTGEEPGIGAACAKTLAAGGARVAITSYRDSAAAQATVEAYGVSAHAIAVQTNVGVEVAALVAFLLSPAADYITGTTVTIDGALSLTVAQGA